MAAGGAKYEEQALFSVRLAGVVSDLWRRFRGPGAEALAAEYSIDVSRTQALRDRVNASIESVRAALTPDKLLWLELRRHEQCHAVISDYAHRVSDKDNWDSRKSTILDDEKLPIAEVIDRCAKLEAAAGGFSLLCQRIARQTRTPLAATHLAFTPLLAGL